MTPQSLFSLILRWVWVFALLAILRTLAILAHIAAT